MDDKEIFKGLLEEAKSNFKDFVKIIISEMQEQINELKRENIDLKNSLEFSQAQLQEVTQGFKKQAEDVERIKWSSESVIKLHENIRSMEDESKKNNLRFDGVEDSQGKNYEQTQEKIQRLIKDKLQLNISLSGAARVGAHAPGRCRTIIATFGRVVEKQACLRAAPKLRGTNVFLNEDLSRESADIRRAKLPELKDLRKRGFIAYFRGINKREDTVRSPSSGTADQLLPEKNQQSSRMTRSNGKSGISPTLRSTNKGANVRTSEEDLISFLTFYFNNSVVYLAEYLPFYGIDNELLKEIYCDDCSYFYNNYDRLYFDPFGDSGKFDCQYDPGI